jgi:SAM-dependent methyltransferase
MFFNDETFRDVLVFHPMDDSSDISEYLSGKRLYGDDWSQPEIDGWYADEKEGYANIETKCYATYRYGYHGWNAIHGYRFLPDQTFHHVLGFGSAFGDEFLPILKKIKLITIVDPSSSFVRRDIHGVPATYVKPVPSGVLPFGDAVFDLVTCFGVLHHIPNVSFVVSELARVMKPGAFILIREPIHSMGDWRRPRSGLTKRERGIPLHIMHSIVAANNLTIHRETLCAFPLTARLFGFLQNGAYNSQIAIAFDTMMSKALAWNINYHPRNLIDRFRPTSVFFVLQKKV